MKHIWRTIWPEKPASSFVSVLFKQNRPVPFGGPSSKHTTCSLIGDCCLPTVPPTPCRSSPDSLLWYPLHLTDRHSKGGVPFLVKDFGGRRIKLWLLGSQTRYLTWSFNNGVPQPPANSRRSSECSPCYTEQRRDGEACSTFTVDMMSMYCRIMIRS